MSHEFLQVQRTLYCHQNMLATRIFPCAQADGFSHQRLSQNAWFLRRGRRGRCRGHCFLRRGRRCRWEGVCRISPSLRPLRPLRKKQWPLRSLQAANSSVYVCLSVYMGIFFNVVFTRTNSPCWAFLMHNEPVFMSIKCPARASESSSIAAN